MSHFTASRLPIWVVAMATAAGALCLCRPTPAFAQQNSSGAAVAAASDQLQEVVVTAERRTENLQTTGIAATVLNADELVQKGVVQMQDLQTASPSLSITPAGLTSNVNIRGIGLDSGSPSVVPGVATYREGLWQPPILTTDSFYDVGSVEILRGPQGTFVGSNSTGGAIFVNSQSPNFNGLNGYLQAQGANYGDAALQGAVNLPIDDVWAARVAVDLEKRESFYTNLGSELTNVPQQFAPPGSLDEKNMRFGLHGKPIGDLDILFKLEVNDKSTGGYAYKPVPGTQYAPFVASANPFVLNYDHYTLNDELGVRGSLKVDWSIGDSGMLFRSLTGVQFMRVHNVEDSDGTSSTLPAGPPAMTTAQAIIERPLTQEFNLISPSTGRLQWVVGTYYLHDIREIELNIQSQGIPAQVVPDFTQVLESAAVFGQISYALVQNLQLQVGVRYTSDRNYVPEGGQVTINLGIPFVPPIHSSTVGTETDSATTGKVALNWTVNDNNFLYGFVSKGFKAGGFNAASGPTPQTNFAPEIVWDYEIGWKGNFLNDHVRANVGGFWNNYTDLQVGAFNPTTAGTSLINTGKSVIKGGELEMHGRFGELHLDMGGAYVNSRLGAISLVDTETLPPGTSVPQCVNGALPPTCFNYIPYTLNLSGDQNPFSPQWTFNAGAEYGIPVGNSGVLTPRLNYSYIGHQWTTLFEAPADYLRSVGLWSSSVTYDNKAWRVQAYILNLADKVYVAGQFAPGSSTNTQFVGNPRQFGVRLSYRF